MKMWMKASAATFALTLAGQLQAANLLTNGSFETPLVTGNGGFFNVHGVGSTSLTGWTIVTDEIAQSITFNAFGAMVTAQDGNNFLDLTGRNDGQNRWGGITQTVATVAGATYRLSFWLGNYDFQTTTTSVLAQAGGENAIFSLAPPSGGPRFNWENHSLDFLATGASTAITLSGQSGFFYTGLDDVSVEFVSGPSGVPEPANWALMIAGFGLTGAAIRRRANVSVTYA